MKQSIKEPCRSAFALSLSSRRVIFAVVLVGIYVRLALAFFPGFPDTDEFVRMVRIVQNTGLGSIVRWRSVEGFPLYPPAFIYQACIASEAINKLSRQPAAHPEAVITSWPRLGVRVVPVGCDILTAVLLYLALARIGRQTLGAWAASVYLFNPGVVANSALWNFDSIPSFLMLLSLLSCGLAFEKPKYAWLTAGSAVCALAFCVKLQAGMFVPVVGAFVLLTRQARVVVRTILAFCLVMVLAYAPFLLQGNWEYLRRVFFVSFAHAPLTHINAYNAWALWFQVPVSTQVLGVSLGNIGRIAYLASLAFAVHALFTKKPANATQQDATRRFAIFGAYLCIAPFVLLTQMHERYLATAIPLAVLAGYLDKRVMVIGIGFSITYALNILTVGISFWKPWGILSQASQYFEPIRLLIIVNRLFCSLLNVALFIWLTLRLRGLLATSPPEDMPRSIQSTSAAP